MALVSVDCGTGHTTLGLSLITQASPWPSAVEGGCCSRSGVRGTQRAGTALLGTRRPPKLLEHYLNKSLACRCPNRGNHWLSYSLWGVPHRSVLGWREMNEYSIRACCGRRLSRAPPWEAVRTRIAFLLVLRMEATPWLGCRQSTLSGLYEMLTSWKYMGQLLNPMANEFGEQN